MLGNITKQGDRYLRSLFTAGALALIRYAKIHGSQHRLAYRNDGAQADQGCRHRARQQNRPNGLGNDGEGRALQGTRRTRGVNEIWRDVKVGRANSR
jgi:transposase